MTLRTSFLPALLALALLGASGAALADDAALLACRALTDTAARLACYDAIPAGSHAAPAPAAIAAPAAADASFGAEQTTRAAPPTSIDTTIPGKFAGWGPSTLFTLANGQVWKVADGSQADLEPVDNPHVRIVRNLFGTMFLEIDGTNASPKVRRVR
jgi:hypothetical protein